MRIKKKKDAVTALVLLAAMGGMYQATESFSRGAFSANTPQFFPLVIIAVIAALSLGLLYTSIDFSSIASEEKSASFSVSKGTLLQIFIVVLLGAYIAVLPLLSYIPATIAFLFLAMSVLLGKKDIKSLAIILGISCLTTGIIWFLFARMLQLFLP